MTRLRIAAIVEGHGEVEAVPVLLRRYAEVIGLAGRIDVDPVIRQPASKLCSDGEIERLVNYAARKLRRVGGILVLLDSDGQCPATLGPALLARVRRSADDIPTAVVLAHQEYEAWFLGSAVSIAGHRHLPKNMRPPPNPESIRGCKEWLSKQMPGNVCYSELTDQPALTSVFDLAEAKSRCPSFDKCDREVINLLTQVAAVASKLQNPHS